MVALPGNSFAGLLPLKNRTAASYQEIKIDEGTLEVPGTWY